MPSGFKGILAQLNSTVRYKKECEYTYIFIFPPTKDEDAEHSTIIIEEFEPDVFRQIIEYIHTSCVTLQPRTLLGARLFHLDLQKRATSVNF